MQGNISCTRRSFLAGASALGAACVTQGAGVMGGMPEAAKDADLMVVLSGLPHVTERRDEASAYMALFVDEVLNMRPMPARCMVVGGVPEGLDDALRPLLDAGVDVLFRPGLVSTRHCDLLVLDGTAVEGMGFPHGTGKRPLLAFADFGVGSPLVAEVLSLPNVAGLLDGCSHRWMPSFAMTESGKGVCVLSLPSAAGQGDMGYVLLRMDGSGAVAELRQNGFRPQRTDASEPNPADWRSAVAANKGASCRFVWKTSKQKRT